MVKKRFSVSLDVKNSSSNRPIEVVEGDNGNEIEVTLTDEGTPVALSGCRVLAIFSKSDGRTAQQDNDGHGITMEDETAGRFTIALYTGSFSPGLVECEIQVLSGEAFTTLVTSAKFNFSCRRSIMNADTVQSTDEYPILVDLIDRVNAAEDELSGIAAQEDARKQAETERLAAEEERKQLSEKWMAVSARAETLSPGLPASVSVTLGESGAAFAFGIPKGKPGDNALPHAFQHAAGEEDAITPQSIGAAETEHIHAIDAVEGLEDALEGKAQVAHTHSKSLKLVGTVTTVLSAAAWEGNTQAVAIQGLGTNSELEVGLAMHSVEAEVAAAASAMLLATAQMEGGITITAFGAVPEMDIPIQVRIWEVEA